VDAFAVVLPEELLETLVGRVVEKIREAPERRFLSKQALAQHLGVSERRLKTLREHGLPAKKVGRDLYFDLREVEEWLAR
jgi:ribosome-binding protein aMBF1 (putative translation factor)